jgi:hypothetical protein
LLPPVEKICNMLFFDAPAVSSMKTHGVRISISRDRLQNHLEAASTYLANPRVAC